MHNCVCLCACMSVCVCVWLCECVCVYAYVYQYEYVCVGELANGVGARTSAMWARVSIVRANRQRGGGDHRASSL